jgi:hypothetical protein
MKKVLLAGILGGVIAFIWSAIVHMCPVTGHLGLSVMYEKEDAVMAALKSNLQQPGLYFFPGMDMTKKMTKEQMDAWTAKYKAGPAGLLLLHPNGGEPMEPKQLVIEFLSTVLCGLIAASILSVTVGSLLCRAAMVAMIGLFGWLAISISQWNWYGYPFSFIALDAIDQVIGWLLAGFLMAKMIKPAQPQPMFANP